MKPAIRLATILGSISILGLAAVCSFASTASAQGSHHESHPAQASLSPQELLASLAHGVTQGAVVFLAGLVAFAALVWLPSVRTTNANQENAVRLLCRWMWGLVGLLVMAGVVELAVFAVRASGEALSLGLLREALFHTQVGHLCIARLVFSLLTATAATYYAARERNPVYWWGTAFIASVLLMTLTQQSHAAADGRFLPFVADWLHIVAGSLWMGGLLGFPILLIGPLSTLPAETRAKLLSRTVGRFSKVATLAVTILIVTGLYATLLHVPGPRELVGTPYGRALIMKLGLLMILLAAGGINLIDRGQGPFGRMVATELVLAAGIFIATGFLTSLAPAG
jgi:copper transport protein